MRWKSYYAMWVYYEFDSKMNSGPNVFNFYEFKVLKYLMVDPTDKDTENIKDWSKGTFLEYTWYNVGFVAFFWYLCQTKRYGHAFGVIL